MEQSDLDGKNVKEVQTFRKIQLFGISLIIVSLLLPYMIDSTLQVSTITVTSLSGSAKDIQVAINQVSQSGGGDVIIPSGTFNFVEVGEPWMTVQVPPGVNIFGAPTERTSGLSEPDVGMSPNNQVVEWKTVLQMPEDPFGGVDSRPSRTWFFQVNGDGIHPFRFSDIKLVGYREIDPTNVNWHGGIQINNVPDFRIDHNSFKHTTGGAVYCFASSGVFDHNRFVNDYGYVAWDWTQCSVAYGIMIYGMNVWETHIDDVIGKYTDQSVFIEDNYFSRWRHVISTAKTAHGVFRHNTVQFDANVGSVDAHGWRSYYLSTRALEVYSNELIDPVYAFNSENQQTSIPSNGDWGFGIDLRGGGGVIFNNYIRNYHTAIRWYLYEVGPDEYQLHDIWLWGNTFENNTVNINPGGGTVENEDYWIITPPTSFPATLPGPTYTGKPSISYTPYPYPHPFVSGEIYIPPPTKNESGYESPSFTPTAREFHDFLLNSNKPHIINRTIDTPPSITVISLFMTNDTLFIVLNGTGVQKIDIFCAGYGKPSEIQGATIKSYSDTTEILTLEVIFASSKTLQISWAYELTKPQPNPSIAPTITEEPISNSLNLRIFQALLVITGIVFIYTGRRRNK